MTDAVTISPPHHRSVLSKAGHRIQNRRHVLFKEAVSVRRFGKMGPEIDDEYITWSCLVIVTYGSLQPAAKKTAGPTQQRCEDLCCPSTLWRNLYPVMCATGVLGQTYIHSNRWYSSDDNRGVSMHIQALPASIITRQQQRTY